MAEHEALCIHCNAALTPRDLDEGWCDSCGKRLPGVARRAPTPPPTTAVPQQRGSWTWALVLGSAVALMGAVAAIAVAG